MNGNTRKKLWTGLDVRPKRCSFDSDIDCVIAQLGIEHLTKASNEQPGQPKTADHSIRDGAQLIYKLVQKLRGFAAIGPFVFGIVLIIGLVIWDAKMLNQVKSEQPAGPAQLAGMQPDGRRAWVQTRGEGSRYLFSRSNGCTLILSD